MNISDIFGSKKDEKKSANAMPGEVNCVPRQFAKNVLVIVDGSAISLKALQYAFKVVSCQPEAVLTAVFVVDTASMDVLQQMRIFLAEERELFEAEIESKGQRVLDEAFEKGKAFGLAVETYMLKGRFSQVVLKAARELKSDLIVMGGWDNASTHKDHTSTEHQLLVDHADSPVLIIKN